MQRCNERKQRSKGATQDDVATTETKTCMCPILESSENESMGKEAGDETAPWGIVSIKAQSVDYELPMNPITQMRNALGKDQGGSGIPLEREAYMESVNYWKDNVVVS